MPLTGLTGTVSYLGGAVNIGLIRKGRDCLVVDTGIDENGARKVLGAVAEAGAALAGVFNTHHHADHCGGNAFLLSRARPRIFAPPIEEAIIRNPILEPASLYGAFPPEVLRTKFFEASASPVDETVTGHLVVGGVEVECLALPGHTLNHHGLLSDGVLFAGDALLGAGPIAKHKLIFLQDPLEALLSLEKIRNLGSSLVVPAHGAPTKDVEAAVDDNVASIERASAKILELFGSPTPVEVAFSRLSSEWQLSPNVATHHLNLASFKAHLASLERRRALVLEVDGGRLVARR